MSLQWAFESSCVLWGRFVKQCARTARQAVAHLRILHILQKGNDQFWIFSYVSNFLSAPLSKSCIFHLTSVLSPWFLCSMDSSCLTSLILHFFQLLSLPVSWFYSSSFPTLFSLMSRDFQRGHLYLENDQKKCLINARCGKYREISEMKMEIFVTNTKKQVLFRCAHK